MRRSRIASIAEALRAASFGHGCGEAIAKRDWQSVVAHHPTSYWACFDVLEPLLTDVEYATTIRKIWCSGLKFDDREKRIFPPHRSIKRDKWMTLECRNRYARLDQVITVYRGCTSGGERGWCWTTSDIVARNFVPLDGLLVTGRVDKQEIFALFNGGTWQESEVVVRGELVNITNTQIL